MGDFCFSLLRRGDAVLGTSQLGSCCPSHPNSRLCLPPSCSIDVQRARRLVASRLVMPTYVISGANKGLGLEMCRQLLAREDPSIVVYALVRSSSHGLKALGVKVVEGIDVSKDDVGEKVTSALAGV